MAPLFAQNNANGGPDEFLIVLLFVICAILLVCLSVVVLFLVTLHRMLAKCRPENRTIEPGMVWLNLIPLFFLVWQFITVVRVSQTLQNEFYDRGWDRGGDDYGKSLGVTTCGLYMAGMIPYCGMLF